MSGRRLFESLPDTIWCFGCERDIPQSAYSINQLSKLQTARHLLQLERQRLQNEGDERAMEVAEQSGVMDMTKFQPVCKDCRAKQVRYITCIICGKTFDIWKFSKSQRRMAGKDNGARCPGCTKLREDLDWAPDDPRIACERYHDPKWIEVDAGGGEALPPF